MQNIKPSQEKRFLKYYNKDAINSTVKDMKIIDYMKENNLGDHINENAITYYGNTLTYKEFEDVYSIDLKARCENKKKKIQEERLNSGKKPLSPKTLNGRVTCLSIVDEQELWTELGKCLFSVKNKLLNK